MYKIKIICKNSFLREVTKKEIFVLKQIFSEIIGHNITYIIILSSVIIKPFNNTDCFFNY